jgi:hypothetical protein
MSRHLLIGAALCCLPGCLFPTPGTPSPVQPRLNGAWQGTFSSSWGDVAMTATIANGKYTPEISGTFALQGQRATGTISGTLDTRQQDPGQALFWGSITLEYPTAGGEACRATGRFGGSVTEYSVSLTSVNGDGFTGGNCSDPPLNVRIQLRR